MTEIQIWSVLGYLKLRMREKKGATQIVEVTSYDSRELNNGSEFRNKSPSVSQREDEEVTDWLSDNPLRFPKDGFPQLYEQGDNTN